MPEEIKLPKQKLEKDYEKNIIPDIYKNLIKRNEEKINQNAKNIEKIAITDNYTVASKVKQMLNSAATAATTTIESVFALLSLPLLCNA